MTVGNETEAALPDDIDSIFDRFYTADQNRSGLGIGRGMGLGLYISRNLVNGMGGLIGAKKDGQRLFITVKLPIVR